MAENKLVEFLYPEAEVRQSPLAILKWWESRRPAFNLVVGGTGVVTLTAVGIITSAWPNPNGPALVQMLGGSLIYGVMANLCYSGGFFGEVLLRKVMGQYAPRPGPALWRMGLTFSIGLTLFPVGIAIVGWAVRFLNYWLR